MPEVLERVLKARAAEHGLKPRTKRYNAYVYGTMNKIEELRSAHQAKRDASDVLRGGKNDVGKNGQ